MTTFTRTFGGGVVQPTYVSFAEQTTAVSLVLSWPFAADTDAPVLAYQNDIVATAGALTITLPDATLVSPGQSALINNKGGNAFTVLSADGTTLGVIASGQIWYFYLTDNSSVGGSWDVTQFGAGTSTANAASLAGSGLVAVMTQLNLNLKIVPLPGNYAPGVGDLATILEGTGGSVTYTPTSAVTLGNGWFVGVINAGSGTLTWAPAGGQTIDGVATKVFQPTESALVFSDGANFWSLGFGQAIVSTTSAVTVPLSTGTVDLSGTQTLAQVQDFVGTLLSDVIVEYGTGAGYWFVQNATSGAHSVTFRVNGSDPGVTVAQGTFSILRSNGSNMSVAFSATSGTVTSVATTSNLTGGPITTSGTLDLSNTTVTPGPYGDASNYPTFTVDQKGRLTAAGVLALPSAPAAGLLATTGDVKFSIANTISSWVLAWGTIGSATSGATNRANADTATLYALLWNNWADAQAPVTGGRGANAAADFAANKPIALPDLRGRVLAGMDTLGSSPNANRLSSVISSSTPGAAGGAQTNSTTTSVNFNSTGTNNINFGSVGVSTTGGYAGGSAQNLAGGPVGPPFISVDVVISSTGATSPINGNFGITVNGGGNFGSAAFTIAQPTMVMNVFVKL